jgi:hypothetical protein
LIQHWLRCINAIKNSSYALIKFSKANSNGLSSNFGGLNNKYEIGNIIHNGEITSRISNEFVND